MAGRPPGRRTRARSPAKAVTRIPASPLSAPRPRIDLEPCVPDREHRGCSDDPSTARVPEREHDFVRLADHTPEELGSAFKAARIARGLRLEDLALAAGVGRRFLGELERGKPTVRLAETLPGRRGSRCVDHDERSVCLRASLRWWCGASTGRQAR
jgi:DNA-binding XRE family transcriptional regulator